jgi:hypothetical protein
MIEMKIPADVPDVEGFVASFLGMNHPSKTTISRATDELVEIVEVIQDTWEAIGGNRKDAAVGDAVGPPPLAQLFITFFAPKNTAQNQLGDLREMFHKNVQRFGEKQARRDYWMEVANSAWPLVWSWLKAHWVFYGACRLLPVQAWALVQDANASPRIVDMPPNAIGIDAQGQKRFHVRVRDAIALEALNGLLISPDRIVIGHGQDAEFVGAVTKQPVILRNVH